MKKTYRDPITGKKIGMIVHDSGVKTFKVWSTDETWSEPPDKTFQLTPTKSREPEVDFSFIKELPEAENHPYLTTKKISALTAKIQENYLVIPFQNQYGDIKGGQKIYPDGKKINFTGSVKTGTFHIIPATTEQQNVYLVEGFATGASVHQATGAKVIVAFGTGNFKNVLSHFTNEKVIIAADNDEAGIKAAKNTGLPYTYPPIEKMDWNDFSQEHSSDEVLFHIHNQLTKTTPNDDDLSFIFLGGEKNMLYFFNKRTKEIHEIDPGSITMGKLICLAPLKYWDDTFATEYKNGGKGVCDLRQASDFLVSKSFEVGKYVKNKVRGVGVWKEDNSIVVNSLNKIWADGKETNYGQIGKRIYISEDTPFLNWTRPADKQEILKLYELISRLSWKNSVSADFLFSWLALSSMAGLLEWRPHIWVCGGRGSGKSEVKREIILPMLNIELDGGDNLGSTEAGVRQSRQVSAAPLIYDEAEVTDERTKYLLDSLIRTISLASDSSNSKIRKGSSGGKSSSFNVNFSACLFSVGVNSLEHPQYRSRFSILELVETKDNGYTGAGGTQEQLRELIKDDFCHRFFSSSLDRLPIFHKNFEVFYKILKRRVSARFAQQVGTLLAGSYTMQFLPDSDEKQIEKFISSKDLVEENLDNSVKNEQDCLHYLFSKKIIETGQSYTIGELIEDVQDDSHEISVRDKKERLLMQHGIKFIKKDDVLAISNTNAELKNIFRGTPWQTGWSRVLGRLPFVFEKSHQVRMNGQNQRCTCIDLIKFNNVVGEENE